MKWSTVQDLKPEHPSERVQIRLPGLLVVDQPESFADLGDAVIQDHAVEAVRRFTGA